MSTEIKIGTIVKLAVPNCPTLVVEKIKQTTTSDGQTDVKRKIISCVWYDAANQSFKREDFYSDTVVVINS